MRIDFPGVYPHFVYLHYFKHCNGLFLNRVHQMGLIFNLLKINFIEVNTTNCIIVRCFEINFAMS